MQMSTIRETTELRQVTARQAFSPLEIFGAAFKSGANARGYKPI
jgi:hypothetical protein